MDRDGHLSPFDSHRMGGARLRRECRALLYADAVLFGQERPYSHGVEAGFLNLHIPLEADIIFDSPPLCLVLRRRVSDDADALRVDLVTCAANDDVPRVGLPAFLNMESVG